MPGAGPSLGPGCAPFHRLGSGWPRVTLQGSCFRSHLLTGDPGVTTCPPGTGEEREPPGGEDQALCRQTACFLPPDAPVLAGKSSSTAPRCEVGAGGWGGVGETLTVACSLRAKVWVDLGGGGGGGGTKVAVLRSV